MKRWAVAVIAVAVLIGGAVGISGMVTQGAGAQDAKDGPWRAIITLGVCPDPCDLYKVNTDALKDMSQLDKLAPAGDPNGSPAFAINVIAKLEQDGCEWQWQPYGAGGQQAERVVILFRC
jgi:hypothetical protein